jgi:hypothetical protein
VKKNYLISSKIAAAAFAAALMCGETAQSQTVTVMQFAFTGSVQTFVVPACNSQVTLEVWGAEGGGSALSGNGSSGFGGKGGYAKGVLNVVAGNTLNVYVGGYGQSSNSGPAAGGYNGGGSGYASSSGEPGNGGGGATDIRFNGNTFANRVIVGGGGGGGGEDTGDPYGHGGGYTGVGYSQYDATQTAAGAGGGIGFGGTTGQGDGGGGGGGYYGGGTLSSGNIGDDTQGGGGGSGYVGTLSSTNIIAGNASMPNPSGGFMTGRSGNGYATITYISYGTGISIASPTAGICTGNSVTFNSSGVVTYTWLPVGSFSGSNSGTITVSPTSSTTYTVQGTNVYGCVTTATANVIVNSSVPALSITSSTNSTCLGKAVSLTASGGITYTWTNPGVVNGQTFVPSSTAEYTVTGQNGCGTSTAVTTISIAPLAIPATANPATICALQAANLSATGATSYSWMPGNMTGSNVIVSPSVTTIYTVTASDGTCTGTSELTLTAKPNPTLIVTGSSGNICEGDQVTITVTGADTYTWNPATLSGTMIVDSPTTATNYMVAGTNSLGCTSNSFHLVLVKPKPILTGNISSTLICPGSSVTLSAGGAVSYAWSHSVNGNPVIVSPLTTTHYSVTGTGSNNCTAMRIYSVNVASPVLTVSGPTMICQGTAVQFTAGAGTGYIWSDGGGQFSTANYTPAQTAVYTVTANVTGGPNLVCKTTGTIQTTVNPNPTVTISGPASTVICRANPLSLTASGAPNFAWSVNNVTGTGSSFTFSSNATVEHTITATGTDANNCKDSEIYRVKVNACTGVEVTSAGNGLSIYPNPNAGKFTVTADRAMTLTVINAIGQEVRKIDLNAANGLTAELENISAGVYYLVGVEGKYAAKIVVTK